MLADRGLIDYDAKVSEYWPEFAGNGKENITVEQALSHQAGLHASPPPYTVERLTDWEGGLRYVEEAAPAYVPGTKVGYHAFTFGLIAGGIVRSATGRHIQDFIRDEIAMPLGVEDEMFVGIPDGIEDRLATLEIWDVRGTVERAGLKLSTEFYEAMPNEMWRHFNEMAVRKACIPAGNGHFTARALAKMYAALAGDGSIDGVRLVSPGRIPLIQRMVTDGFDIVLGMPGYKGVGFTLGGEMNHVSGPMGRRVTAFGHSGAGGSIGFADPDAGLAIGVTLNKMEWALPGMGRTQEICDLIRAELQCSS